MNAVALPSVAPAAQWSPSPPRGAGVEGTLSAFGNHVSPITRCQQQQATGATGLTLPALHYSPSSSLGRSSSVRSTEQYVSPTGFFRPTTLPTPMRTVRRNYHHASPADRKAFYAAFLDRPSMNTANPSHSWEN